MTARVFRCECTAFGLECDRVIDLGGQEPGTAWAALLWVSWRAGHIADQLDPPAARPVRAWLADDREAGRALAQLNAGESYLLIIADGATRYVLSATPVPS
ncbi:hypothetical protein [Streptomyces hainanensis]|uniref:Uncharacterized protein n=1 Tax=Streptomyces hainanensis TaxID=402648 RepID=A0A4R4T6S8_9ACTN|nr:hypothetical protein [Streptomyces hainanensis]TDC71084.1 hypothetical protein E1283_23920 [Streptomyces hainanensis]